MTPPADLPSAMLAPDATTISLCVPAAAIEVAGIRRAVRTLARNAGLADDRLGDVALAVGEACANVVVHAYVGTRPGVLRVSAAVTADGLDVIVADDGGGMAPRADSPGLGLGLPLMASLTSSLQVRVASSGGAEIHLGFAARGAIRAL